MKIIDYLYKNKKEKLESWTDSQKEKTTKKRAIENFCPGMFGVGPVIDFDNNKADKDSHGYYLTNGCRGITCIECWNKESEKKTWDLQKNIKN